MVGIQFSFLQTCLVVCALIQLSCVFTESIKTASKPLEVKVLIEEAICEVRSNFASVAIGNGEIQRRFKYWDFQSKKLLNIFKALYPAYLRIGGSRANFMTFVKEGVDNDINLGSGESELYTDSNDVERTSDENVRVKRGKQWTDFEMFSSDFDKIMQFANKSRLQVLFDLNAFFRLPDGSWNESNALELLDYAADQGYKIDWQLGNEPKHYKKYGEYRALSGAQVGRDFQKLRAILNNTKYQRHGRVELVGPDITRPRGRSKPQEWVADFLHEAKNVIDVFSWHQYYIDGRTATFDDFVNPDVLNEFFKQNMRIRAMLKKAGVPNKRVWITETGSAWGGGAADLSNRYAAGFPLLDKLGIAALFCTETVMRQTAVGGKYAMLDLQNGVKPLPDFFTTILYKKLVGSLVLDLQAPERAGKLRIYAHCKKLREETKPGVTIIALNLQSSPVSFNVKPFDGLPTVAYILTADDPSSSVIKLNDRPLEMVGDELPDLTSQKVVQQPYTMPAYSYGYFVVDYDVPACKDEVQEEEEGWGLVEG